MGKIAFIFSGQGAQYGGMGQDFYNASDASKAVFDKADGVRANTMNQCCGGDAETLAVTENTQPCLFTTEMAMAAALTEAGIKADCVAGFSLGELAALSFAGALEFDAMLALVVKRAALMQEAAEKHPAKMAAVLKLKNEEVEALCADIDGAYPVNFNCPGQVTVSASEEAMPLLMAKVKEAGGRTMPLKVGGGFHSPFMDEAAEAFAAVLKDTAFSSLSVPAYANVSGCAYSKDVREDLSLQMNHAVKWEAIVRQIIEDGCDTFIEVGPGETLTGMMKRIDKDVRVFSAENVEKLNKIVQEVKPC